MADTTIKILSSRQLRKETAANNKYFSKICNDYREDSSNLEIIMNMHL